MSNLSDILLTAKYQIQEARFATVDSFWSKIVSFYQYNRLYLVTEGNAEMKFTNTVYKLEKGMLYFIPSHSIISGECEKIMSHYFIHFNLDTYLNNLLKLIISQKPAPAAPIDEEMFKIIVDKNGSKKLDDQILCDGALRVILSNFFNNSSEFSTNMLRFVDTIAFINNNLTERITVKQLAERMNLSEAYFSSSFKQSFGITPQQHIISQKMEYACTLLAMQTLSIKEIAFMLHFTDESHFSRLFKQKCGLSPLQFRQRVT